MEGMNLSGSIGVPPTFRVYVALRVVDCSTALLCLPMLVPLFDRGLGQALTLTYPVRNPQPVTTAFACIYCKVNAIIARD